MLAHYVLQTVAPSAHCSYPRGRTLLNVSAGAYADMAAAESVAERFNGHCDCPGVSYAALSTDDERPEGFDRLERN